MPLNNFAVSNLPAITGGRVGVGSGVGVALISAGAKYCNCSCEIQRYRITTKIAAAKAMTSRRNVRRRILATRLLFYPGEQRHDDADHAQDRHHASGHRFPGADKFWDELRGQKQRNNERGRE